MQVYTTTSTVKLCSSRINGTAASSNRKKLTNHPQTYVIAGVFCKRFICFTGIKPRKNGTGSTKANSIPHFIIST